MFRMVLSTGILLICFLCCLTMNADAKVLGYWTFDDKNDLGEDSSPLGNDGEIKGDGSAEWTAKGKVSGGLSLNNAWIEVPHNDSLNLKDQATLMCWVKFANPGDFAAGGGREQSLIWKYGPFETNKRFWTSYALRVWRPKSNFGSFGFDANMTEGRSAAVDKEFPDQGDIEGTWYHIAATLMAQKFECIPTVKRRGRVPKGVSFRLLICL